MYSRFFLRGVQDLSIQPDKQKYNTNTQLDIVKISRPFGNPGRSVSTDQRPAFSGVGYAVKPKHFHSFDPEDCNTGRGSKHQFTLTASMPWDQVIDSIEKLNDMRNFQHTHRESQHDECIATIEMKDIAFIYFYPSINFCESYCLNDYWISSKIKSIDWISTAMFLEKSYLIQAIFLQAEFSGTKRLDIYRYCPLEADKFQYIPNLNEEKILKLWTDLVHDFFSFLEKLDGNAILCMTPEDVKNLAVFGYNMYPGEKKRVHLDVHYSVSLREKIDGMIRVTLDKKIDSILQKSMKSAYIPDIKFQILDLTSNFQTEYEFYLQNNDEDHIHNIQNILDMCIQQFLFGSHSGQNKHLLNPIFLGFIYLNRIKPLCQFVSMHRSISLDEAYDILLGFYKTKILNIETFHKINEEFGGKYTDGIRDVLTTFFSSSVSNPKWDTNKMYWHIQVAEKINLDKPIYYDLIPRALISFTLEKQSELFKSMELFEKYVAYKKLEKKYAPLLVLNLEANDAFTMVDFTLNVFINHFKKQYFKHIKETLYAIKLKPFLTLRMRSQAYFDSDIYRKEMKILAIGFNNQIEEYILQKMDAIHTYFYSESADIPLRFLTSFLAFYTADNPEFGSLPMAVFALVMVLGIRIIIRNPHMIDWYLNKLEKANMPSGVHRILEDILNRTLYLYPEYRDHPMILNGIKKLHPEFADVLQKKPGKLPALPDIPMTMMSQDWILPDVADALKFVSNKYLNKPYKNNAKEGTQFPVIYLHNGKPRVICSQNYGVIKLGPNDTYPVYRSNHGFPHTARKVLYIYPVVDFNLVHAVAPVKKYLENQCNTLESMRKFLAKLQMASGFSITGREGEDGFKDDKERYEEYRENSAKNFRDYAIKHLFPGLFDSLEEIELYADCLKNNCPSDMEAIDLQDPIILEQFSIKSILYGAHGLDLIRLYGPQEIESRKVEDLMKAIPLPHDGEALHHVLQLFHWAGVICRKMGDSVFTIYNEKTKHCEHLMTAYSDLYDTHMPKTDVKQFIEYANQPNKLIQLLNNIDIEFKSNIMLDMMNFDQYTMVY